MSSIYPGGLDSFPTNRTDATPMVTNQPGDHNDYADAINKIEATLGVNPQGGSATVVDRLDSLATPGLAAVLAVDHGAGGSPISGLSPGVDPFDAATVSQLTGSVPGASIVRGPFVFAFDTPNINNGVDIYVPTVGDVLLDAWYEVDVAFDGTTPFFDLGTFVASTIGLWNGLGILDTADDEHRGTGLLIGPAGPNKNIPAYSLNSEDHRFVPAKFVATNPLKIIVSQDGLIGGAAIGGAQGAGAVYFVTSTPVPF